jgi:hydrogenase-4 component B
MTDIFIALCFLLGGGSIALFLSRYKKVAGFAALFSNLGACAIVVSKVFHVLIGHEPLTYSLNLGFPMAVIRFEIDGLSAFFLLIIYFFSLTALFYGQGCLKPYYKKKLSTGVHFFTYNLLVASMTVVVIVHNALFFLIAWEVMSLASFFLILHEHNKEKVRSAALNYLVTMHVSAVFLLVAFIIPVIKTESLDFTGFIQVLSGHDSLSYIVFLLFFIGFGFKIGFFPLHSSLAHVYTLSHASVSVIMSGVMKKVAFYGILRILSFVNIPQPSIGYTVIFVSLVTCLVGIIYAVLQKDIKKLLAYSSIENAGIIGIAVGTGILGLSYHISTMALFGFAGALFHIVNHALFKSLLFMGAGAVYHVIGTRNIESMGGLLRRMPVTGWTFLIGSMAICALPPFNGFISEFLIYSSLLMGIESSFGMLLITRTLAAAGIALTGGLALIALTKIFGIAFVGQPRSSIIQRAHDPDFFMTVPLIVVSFLCFIIGLWPHMILKLLHAPLSVLASNIPLVTTLQLRLFQMTGNITKIAIIFLIIASILYAVHYFLLQKRNVKTGPTWGCGYGALSHRMQYTGSSFSSFAVKLLLPSQETIQSPKGFFPPRPVTYSSQVKDPIEILYDRLIWKNLRWLLNRLSWIQSGQKQHYILYILIVLLCFLVAALWGEM